MVMSCHVLSCLVMSCQGWGFVVLAGFVFCVLAGMGWIGLIDVIFHFSVLLCVGFHVGFLLFCAAACLLLGCWVVSRACFGFGWSILRCSGGDTKFVSFGGWGCLNCTPTCVWYVIV